MWMRGSSGAAPDLTLRTGAALVGVDPEALWVDCCAAANEDLPYDSVTAAVLGTGQDLEHRRERDRRPGDGAGLLPVVLVETGYRSGLAPDSDHDSGRPAT